MKRIVGKLIEKYLLREKFALLVYEDGCDETNPEYHEIDSLEVGRACCDHWIKKDDIYRVEVCELQEGQVLYGRGYRKHPGRSFPIRSGSNASNPASHKSTAKVPSRQSSLVNDNFPY